MSLDSQKETVIERVAAAALGKPCAELDNQSLTVQLSMGNLRAALASAFDAGRQSAGQPFTE